MQKGNTAAAISPRKHKGSSDLQQRAKVNLKKKFWVFFAKKHKNEAIVLRTHRVEQTFVIVPTPVRNFFGFAQERRQKKIAFVCFSTSLQKWRVSRSQAEGASEIKEKTNIFWNVHV